MKANAPLLRRVFAFVVAFGVAALILDWRTIHTGLANSYGFGIYGEAGKSLLIGIIAFVMLVRRSKRTFKLPPWRLHAVLWLIGAVMATIVGWVAVGKFSTDRSHLEWLFIAHACLVLILTFLLYFAFGMRNLYTIVWHAYRREVLISLGLSALFEVFLIGLYTLWPYLSSAVLGSVKVLFDVIGIHAVYVPLYTLIFSKFTVTVGEYCSGIDSAALFTALYVLIGVLDWPRLNHKRYLLVFAPALLVIFGFNILRVFLLILAGYYINPQIAFSLFHTYAGMIFFIVYSAAFWKLSYRWMLKNPRDGIAS